MQVQDISLTQIIVVLLFLGVLIVLQQMLKNNKFKFQIQLNKNKRIRFIDEFALNNSERIRLIKVDNNEYLHFSTKGCSPTVILHEGYNSARVKQDIKFRKLSSKLDNRSISREQQKNEPSILSDAISNARKMNPKLGFKKWLKYIICWYWYQLY